MSVAANDRIAKEAGNDVKVAFDFAFKIFAATDLRVEKISAAGVYSGALTLGVDYLVAFDSDAQTGTVTYVVAPVTSGFSVIMGTEAPQTQETAYPREGIVPAATQKSVVDKLTVLVQQLAEQVSRALLQPLTPVNPDPISVDGVPADRRALIYEDNGDGTWSVVPSDYDPDALVNEATVLATAYGEGLIANRPLAPTTRMAYYATDTDEYAHYIPTAGRWFPLG